MPKPQQIRLLPVHVANKIAAGEVVERPAAVVKELMENAFDAAATRIEVTISAGGRRLIAIADDGLGMGRDDALMALEPQATSKIRDVDDIEKIATYGFRGEALPSISAVSRLTLRTCREDEPVGTEVVQVGGRLQEVNDIGFPRGTTIEVRDLFFNVPARRKYLRSYQTEQNHIRTTFIMQALSHPETALRLKIDGREVHSLPAGATLAERIAELFGSDFMGALRPVAGTLHNVTISGYVGIPTFTRADRGEQYIFVNRRAASAAVIPYALREAYPPLEGSRKPIVILFIDLPPAEVDVNVHPTKREVRFRTASEVRDAIITAVAAALGTAPRLPPTTPPWQAPGATSDARPTTGAPIPPPHDARGIFSSGLPLRHPRIAADYRQVAAQPATIEPSGGQPPGEAPAGAEPATAGVAGAPLPHDPTPPAAAVLLPGVGSEAPWAWCRILGEAGSRYILLETDGGYVVSDPRAAHERVLYERLMEPIRSGQQVTSQALLLPETVQLPPEDAERLRQHLPLLREMGFMIDAFGEHHFIIEALPAELGNVDSRELLTSLSHAIEAAGARRGVAKWREEAMAEAACRTAVRHSEPLKAEEIAVLVESLAGCRMPYTCPRGRPTMILTPWRELARKFGRD